GDHAAIEVGAPARREPDQHLELLALEERRLCGGRTGGERNEQYGGGRAGKHRAHGHYSAALMGVCVAVCSAKIGRPAIRTSIPLSELNANSSRPENAEYLRSGSPFTAPSPLVTKPTWMPPFAGWMPRAPGSSLTAPNRSWRSERTQRFFLAKPGWPSTLS